MNTEAQDTLFPTRKVLVGAVTGGLTAFFLGVSEDLVAAVPMLDWMMDEDFQDALIVLAGFCGAYVVEEWVK